MSIIGESDDLQQGGFMDKKEFQKLSQSYQINEETLLYGITPRLGAHLAERFKNLCVLEICTGAGFLTIELAKVASKVITIDISALHQKQAKNNAVMAGVDKNIDFIVGDALAEEVLNNILSVDAAILDPVWHGDTLSSMMPPADRLLEVVFKKTKNVALILPPNIDISSLSQFSYELEALYLDGELALWCLYFGKLYHAKKSKFES